jgi:pilus assembly protein Flp/PilA
VSHFKKLAHKLWRDESGATAIEYGLLAALIAVVIIGVVASLGQTLEGTFQSVDNDLKMDPAALAAAAAGGGGGGGGGDADADE